MSNLIIPVPAASIQKVSSYGLSTIAIVSGGVSFTDGTTVISNSGVVTPAIDYAYVQANIATSIATSGYTQANSADSLARSAYTYANTLAGGSATDNVARVSAQAAFNAANTAANTGSNNYLYLSGVNSTQNSIISTQSTSISLLQGAMISANANIVYLFAVNTTQNTNTSAVNTYASSSYAQGNTNSELITIIQGVDLTQNTNISSATNIAQAAYNLANTISGGGTTAIDSYARITANAAFASANGKVDSVTGTTNQVIVTGTTTPTLSLPQDIATSSSVRFGSLGIGVAATGTTGEIISTDNITAYYSDDRLKTKLGKIENALDKLCSLEGFYYEANETAQALGYKVKREVGLSAQSTQAVLPEIVAPAPIDNQYLTIRYEKFAPLFVEAIKELRKELEEIKAKLP